MVTVSADTVTTQYVHGSDASGLRSRYCTRCSAKHSEDVRVALGTTTEITKSDTTRKPPGIPCAYVIIRYVGGS